MTAHITAAAASAVSGLHHPIPTTLGVDACAHCTALHGGSIIRWPCPTRKHADVAGRIEAGRAAVSVADRIEAEEDRIRRLTPGDAGWESPAFRAGMLHAAAIVRAEP